MVGIPMDGVGWGVLECGCYCTAVVLCNRAIPYTLHDCTIARMVSREWKWWMGLHFASGGRYTCVAVSVVREFLTPSSGRGALCPLLFWLRVAVGKFVQSCNRATLYGIARLRECCGGCDGIHTLAVSLFRGVANGILAIWQPL
jgi:hypothetical protein